MCKYLSPFQQIIMNHVEKTNESQENKSTKEKLSQDINYFGYMIQYYRFFIDLTNFLMEVCLNNKFMITALVLNFTLLWYCIVSKPRS